MPEFDNHGDKYDGNAGCKYRCQPAENDISPRLIFCAVHNIAELYTYPLSRQVLFLPLNTGYDLPREGINAILAGVNIKRQDYSQPARLPALREIRSDVFCNELSGQFRLPVFNARFRHNLQAFLSSSAQKYPANPRYYQNNILIMHIKLIF